MTEPAQQPPAEPLPIAQQLNIGIGQATDGQKVVILSLSMLLEPEAAKALAARLEQTAVQASTGLVVPPLPVMPANGNGHG